MATRAAHSRMMPTSLTLRPAATAAAARCIPRAVPRMRSARPLCRPVRAVPESLDGTPGTAAARPIPSFAPVSTISFDEEDGMECELANIFYDNDLDDKYTMISVDVPSFPGLLRVVTWVLTGLNIKVHRAQLRTDPFTGAAKDVFWVSENGGKLRDPAAVVDRMSDYVQYCQPSTQQVQSEVFHQGPVFIDNKKDDTRTYLELNAKELNNVQLLDVVSAISGLGMSINEADVQESSGSWTFYLETPTQQKLDYTQIQAVMYMLFECFGSRQFKPF